MRNPFARSGPRDGDQVTDALGGDRDASVDRPEHPVDASIEIRATNISWCANPVTTLRPLASDLNVTKRGRCITTS